MKLVHFPWEYVLYVVLLSNSFSFFHFQTRLEKKDGSINTTTSSIQPILEVKSDKEQGIKIVYKMLAKPFWRISNFAFTYF